MNTVKHEVLNASQTWIEQFNQGNIDYCVNTYTPEASMRVYPFGHFQGIESIGKFWRDFHQNNPSDLRYSEVEVHVLDEKLAALSAKWSMNIGEGFISKELWQKNNEGRWCLLEDDFSVVKSSL